MFGVAAALVMTAAIWVLGWNARRLRAARQATAPPPATTRAVTRPERPPAKPAKKAAEEPVGFNIEVANVTIRREGKAYRYTFDVRNDSSRPFKGGLIVELCSSYIRDAEVTRFFPVDDPIEPGQSRTVSLIAEYPPAKGPTDEKGIRVIDCRVTVNGRSAGGVSHQIKSRSD
jgi:hypothetical protein